MDPTSCGPLPAAWWILRYQAADRTTYKGTLLLSDARLARAPGTRRRPLGLRMCFGTRQCAMLVDAWVCTTAQAYSYADMQPKQRPHAACMVLPCIRCRQASARLRPPPQKSRGSKALQRPVGPSAR